LACVGLKQLVGRLVWSFLRNLLHI
jgi:hypothetical protein